MNEQKFLIKIGEKIKTFRAKGGIDQQYLAAACNFEKFNISRIEAGRSNLISEITRKFNKQIL